ncbi:hypothetical protein H632_c1402p1 [Helicosporidium sp. ATCC 50920]|nr:hypothetical protein H632_c1402p1 [Helicosporidium sp. ATCC 50920]|eukprot:KDD74322.1 hypothetical protein H632_c1402p1 [Helicosporidium sp. ATCC 50920]
MGLGGVVLAVPVPEAEARTGEEVGAAIETALREVRARGVAGRDVTPFLLDRVRQLTGGKSLDTNVALVKNNAAVAARVATELCGLMKDRAVVESKAVARL